MSARSVRLRGGACLAVGLGSVLGALALAGCSGGTDSGTAGLRSSGSAALAPGPAATPAPGLAQAAASGSSSSGDAAGAAKVAGAAGPDIALLNRSVIRTAGLTLRVPDVLAASARVSALTSADGGFVAGEQTDADPDQPTRAQAVLTLRVPSTRLPQLLTQLHGLGTLLSEQQAAQDVTGQVIDVQARIAAQKASVARITALMARANTLGQVVQIEGELTSRQAALESLQGQAAALADQTSLATVTATLVESTKPVVVATSKPASTGFGAGLSKGWHAFATAGTWLLTAIGTLLPFLLVVVPLLALASAVVRRRSRGPVVPAPSEPPPAAA